MINDLFASIFLIAGAFLMLLAGLGSVRMPDLLMRMHATTKAGALGSGLIMLGVATHFLDSSVTARCFAIILFIMLTAPVAAHMIGRAGYFVGVPLWHNTIRDDLQGQYDNRTHFLNSSPQYHIKESSDKGDET